MSKEPILASLQKTGRAGARQATQGKEFPSWWGRCAFRRWLIFLFPLPPAPAQHLYIKDGQNQQCFPAYAATTRKVKVTLAINEAQFEFSRRHYSSKRQCSDQSLAKGVVLCCVGQIWLQILHRTAAQLRRGHSRIASWVLR